VKFSNKNHQRSRGMFKSVAVTSFSGLGNILYIFCKAFLASRAFNCPLYLPIPFDLPRRHIYFNPLKVGARIALAIGLYRFKARDEIEFSKAQYMEICNSTNEFDYGLALGEFCRRNNKSKGTLIAKDLWGWFYAIERAKPWVYSILMSDVATRKNLTTIGYLKNPRKPSRSQKESDCGLAQRWLFTQVSWRQEER
jgi:hypothetical protein